MVQLQELACRRDERRVFEPVSDVIQARECVEVLGPNGAGKTTLLRTLAGIHSQYEGAYRCEDFLYQGHRVGLDELLDPVQNLRWFGALQGQVPSEQQLADALTRVGMFAYAMTPCQRLSQGQQRRVAMARWLLSPASVWLLDEPYTSLDRDGQQLLNDLLAEHCDGGGSVLCATHTPLTVGGARQLRVTPAYAAAGGL